MILPSVSLLVPPDKPSICTYDSIDSNLRDKLSSPCARLQPRQGARFMVRLPSLGLAYLNVQAHRRRHTLLMLQKERNSVLIP